jgi:N-acetylglucosaminyl-diphospho-decaprenol L-rhamnosyltransferase
VIDLSIIIVSWNVAALLQACLDSILTSVPDEQQSRLEIIVVDSASTDDTANMIRQHYPQVRLLPQTENVGFSRGNNIGMQAAQGRYLFLLNPDTEIIGDALAQMIAFMDADPDVGIIGPHTLNSDGTTQSTRRHFPTFLIGLLESTWLQPLAPKSVMDYYYFVDGADENDTLEVDWVQGSAVMARREVYEQIGGMDEGYFMYSEELDWCKRAKDIGWRVVYFGGAQIVHHGGKSSEQATTRTQIHFQRSKLRYFRKYHGPLVAQTIRVVLLLNYVWQLGLESLKRALGSKRDLRRERIHAYWQVLRSGLRAR